jgi:hypothetical protein
MSLKIKQVCRLVLGQALILTLFPSCSGQKPKTENSLAEPRESINLLDESDNSFRKLSFLEVLRNENKIDEKSIDELIDTTLVFKLETNNNCLIGNTDRIYLIKNHIVILDKDASKSVFVFRQDGKFVNKYNKFGKGPGEFTSLNDIAVSNDSIYILINNRIIMRFDVELKDYVAIKLDCWAGELALDKINSGFVITGASPVGDVIYCNSSGESVGHFLPNHNSSSMFSPNPFSISGGNVLFYHPHLDTTYVVNNKGYYPVRHVNRNREKGYHITYFETDKNIILYLGNRNFIYKSLLTMTEYTVPMKSDTPYYDLIYSNYFITNCQGDYYCSKLEPTKLLKEQKIREDQIEQLKSNVNIDSNPILILTKFK